MELLQTIFAAIGLIVSGATLIVLGLEKVAAVTPSTRDDEYVGAVKQALGVLASVLSRVAINPKGA